MSAEGAQEPSGAPTTAGFDSPSRTERDAPPRLTRLALPALLLLSLGLNLLGNGWGLPNDKSWSNDDPTPDAPLAISEIWSEGWHKYPYLLPWIDRTLYAPQLAAWRADGSLSTAPECSPPTDDDCFRDVDAQMGRLMHISRIARAVMGVGVVLAVYLLAAALVGGPSASLAGLLAAAVAAFSQVLVFYAHVGNVDVPMTFFFAWSMLAWLHALREPSLRHHAAFGALGGAALACKEAIYGAYVLPGMALVALAVWRMVRERRGRTSAGGGQARGNSLPALSASTSRSSSTRPSSTSYPILAPLAAGLSVLLVYGLALNVLGNPNGFREHVSYWTSGTGIAPWNDGFAGHAALARTALRRLAEGMSLPLLAMAAGGATYALRRPQARWMLLPAASYYLFTIATVRFAYTRFTLPVVIVLAAMAGVGWMDAFVDAGTARSGAVSRTTLGRAYRVLLAASITLALAHGLLYSLHTDLLLRVDARYAAEDWLQANLPPESEVAVYGSRTHLPRLGLLGFDDVRIDKTDFSAAGFASLDDGGPTWLVLSEKNVRGLDGEPGAWRNALIAGEAGYEVVHDEQGRSGLEPWLIDAWTESRVNPRTWVLQKRTEN